MFKIFKKNVIEEKLNQTMMAHLKTLSYQALKNESKLKLDCQGFILFPMCCFAVLSLIFMGRENTLLQFLMFAMIFGSIVLTNRWSNKFYQVKSLKNKPFFNVKEILEDTNQQLALLYEIEQQKNILGKENIDNINYQLKKLFLTINQSQLTMSDLTTLNKIIGSYESIENNQKELSHISQEYDRYVNKNHFHEKEMTTLQKRL